MSSGEHHSGEKKEATEEWRGDNQAVSGYIAFSTDSRLQYGKPQNNTACSLYGTLAPLCQYKEALKLAQK